MSTETSSESTNPNFVRVAQTPVRELTPSAPEVKVDSTITAGATESPIDIYEGKTGKPYLVDMLDIAELFGKSDYESEIKTIDKFVLDAIEVQDLTKTKESYRSMVNRLISKLNMDPNLQYDKKIERLATYVKVLNDQKVLALKKKALEYVSTNK